jgi:SAM-dependent methyltransferase
LVALDLWLAELTPRHKVLDLGCGSGSMPSLLAGLSVVGIDLNLKELSAARGLAAVCGRSDQLPFAAGSFDLVISHHSLEHFRDATGAIHEIGRVLKPAGRLFVSVPEGASFTDRLYRFLFCGGDHWQRFTLHSAAGAIETVTGLRLAASQELFTSFIFLAKENFLAAPRGRLPGPLPRRMRWLSHLPAWSFTGARGLLNICTRLADRWFSTSLSRYGWAMAFSRDTAGTMTEPGLQNVCMFCGAGIPAPRIEIIRGPLYRCPVCFGWNWYFKPKA